ncbi:MAG: S41 family peptidase [Crocinitomicaceae bacterium]|nr:S41 family peptidase [Crocinitomicaceae bacterium]
MMKLIKHILILPFVGLSVLAFSQNEKPSDFEIYKNLELFELVYKTIDVDYVDESDPGHLMRVAIDEMLKELDPYTTYIPESQIEDFKLMTTGQYGGIGALIQQQGDKVVVSDPHEGYPAQKSGLYAGDIFIEINGQNVQSLSSSEISEKLKGKPGSEVKVKVDRNGEMISKTLVREEVKLSPVPFHDMVSEDIGYIKLNQFTQTAGTDVLAAFRDLKGKNMKKLILDLRGNPGGLLIEAVKIVNMFVKKGEVIVWMKGRDNRNDVSYSASLKPEDLEMPITVLVDGNSASASEIVSGALQDLDRAVVVGQTSYGKGLVQRPLDLKYNAKIKVTIAKYYTPSGRCIQKLDYSSREAGDKVEAISDSLITKFKTRNGREVIDGRGIEPDITVERGVYSRLTATLVIRNVIFDFATKFRAENETIAEPQKFKIDDAIYQQFVDFTLKQDFEYSTESSEIMDKLQKAAEEENFMEDAKAEYEALMEKLKPSKERDLMKFKEEIIEVLEDEIIGRYYYQTGRIKHSLDKDPFILEAIKILNDPARYKEILKIQE